MFRRRRFTFEWRMQTFHSKVNIHIDICACWQHGNKHKRQQNGENLKSIAFVRPVEYNKIMDSHKIGGILCNL